MADINTATQAVVEELGLIWPDEAESMHEDVARAVLAAVLPTRETIALALKGHRLDTMSQDSGNHCECGSDSRFDQPTLGPKWSTMNEHRADMVLRVLRGTDG